MGRITCPSGLEGEVRALRVVEEKITRDPKTIKSGAVVYDLAKTCWIETYQTGPNGDIEVGTKPIDWRKVPQGDAFYVFLRIRALTYGNDYDFQHSCEGCRSTITWTLLFDQFDVKPFSEEGLACWKGGPPIETTTESGIGVRFCMLSGEDDRYITNMMKGRDITHNQAATIQRIVSVDGIDEHDRDARLKVVRWVENLDAGEADALHEAMELHDCGVDTDIEIVCKNCFFEQVISLPLGPGFFRRQRKKKKMKKATPSDPTSATRTGSSGMST